MRLGAFALLTLILACAAVGRVAGLGLSETLYLSALMVFGLISMMFRQTGRR